jgi:hypothetical protein
VTGPFVWVLPAHLAWFSAILTRTQVTPKKMRTSSVTSSLQPARPAADLNPVLLDLLQHQAENSGATLVVAAHDRRLTSHFGHRLLLGASA